MLPHFFAMNRQNYARYLPVYLADMQQLELTHPDVYNEFAAGNHTISHSGQPFLPTWPWSSRSTPTQSQAEEILAYRRSRRLLNGGF